MKALVKQRGKRHDIIVRQHPYDANIDQYLLGLSEHDLRVLEFVLAQRRAMSRRCTAGHGEHTCSLAPDHISDPGHVCRACDFIWPVQEPEAADGTQ